MKIFSRQGNLKVVKILTDNTINYVKDFFNIKPKVAVVLGSGVKALESLKDEKNLSYSDIPDFPKSTVAGHAGVISIGECENNKVAVLRGRFHKYEGYNWKNVISPIFLMKELGTEYMILTNAAGGINRIYTPGDLMLMEDHINFHQMDEEERKALYESLENRRDISFYDKDLLNIARNAAIDSKVKVHDGVYVSLPGPSYETRAEILMFQKMNVDAVGMSTVPEAIWAKALKMKTLGISCITNSTYYEKAMSETSHEEVVTIAKKASQNIDTLLRKIIKEL